MRGRRNFDQGEEVIINSEELAQVRSNAFRINWLALGISMAFTLLTFFLA